MRLLVIGRRKDVFHGWGAAVVKFHFTNSKVSGKHFSTKTFWENSKFQVPMGAKVPLSDAHASC